MRRLPTLLAVLVSASIATADEIHLTDGKTITDADIKSETHEHVTYRKDRRDEQVSSDSVLSVVYSQKPQAVDTADAAIARDEYPNAEFDLRNFLDVVKERVPSKYPWSRAYAYYRLVTVYEVMGEVADLTATADEMAELEPDSRYLPFVLVKKAQALADSGDKAKALAAMADLEKLIRTKGLSTRWQLELELGRVVFGNDSGATLRRKLQDVADRAGAGNPVVRNRARVAIGGSLLVERDVEGAEAIFESITSDAKADSRTLAGAYTGLGQCLLRRGEAAGDSALIRAALKSFMRVVVLYKNEINYLPESLFYAGRCWQLLGGDDAEEKATKLYNKVIRTFPENKWATEARGFRVKND